MTKDQATEVKNKVDEITSVNFKKTFSNKSGKLHIRIGTYNSGHEEEYRSFISEIETERDVIINELKVIFPQYKVEKNNKRNQGFINDICITVE